MEPHAEQTGGLSSFQDIIEQWKNDHIDKLKELHRLRRDLRRVSTESEQEVLDLLNGLLDFVDSFGNTHDAVDNALEKEDKKARRVLRNFGLLHRELKNILKKFGVAAMEVDMSQFVAGLHKAVDAEYDPQRPEGEILTVTKSGYYWKNRILRQAEVVINTSGGHTSEASDEPGSAG